MDKTIEQLEFRILINDIQKKTKNWESTIMDPRILYKLSFFLTTRIGKIWLNSPEGQDFTKWQNE